MFLALHLEARRSCLPIPAVALIVVSLTATAQAGPWAAAVVGYDPGTAPAAGFTNPLVALGSPERFTGEGTFPGAVTMFNPPFGTDELVSIGEGGQLTVRFDVPVENDPSHLFGADLILFGNSGFIDAAFPSGQIGTPAALFGADLATVEVSADGVSFFPVALPGAGLFPTQGFLDVSPFQGSPGSVPSQFLKPVDPSLTLSSFDGLSYADALALYDGSGGGAPIDIAASGLSSVSFVRVSLPDDGDPGTALTAEIDALARVPEPATGVLVLGVALLLGGRRRRA